MKTNNRKYIAAALLLMTSITTNADTLKGRITDARTGEAIPYATVTITDAEGMKHTTVSDISGNFSITATAGKEYVVSASYLGYTTATIRYNDTEKRGTGIIIRLKQDSRMLNEVVVTAHESQGITTSSVIDRKAIEHLQPSSFTDLLSLLPGGSSQLPDLTNANSIRLRQAGTGGSNYDVSAMGTVFVTDGIPINSNANMQQVRQASSSTAGDPDAGRNHTASGVDMRSIPTDDIESVEVIRGIAPVEYGDLTSGVVLIKRKLKPTPFEARFKADSYSKLVYAGKGMQTGNFIMNLGLDFLDAKADPRNPMNNYKRLTASARMQDSWTMGSMRLRWRSNTDYTGSFDNEKHDPEILKQKDDRYKSDYNRFSMTHSLLLSPGKESALKSLNLDMALAYEWSRISQQKSISLSRDMAASTSLEEGEHDGMYLPYQYISNVTVDGKPLNLYAKIKALFAINTGSMSHSFSTGAEWKMDKNYGSGQQYDPARPISPGTPYRPRIYSHIPAMHQLGFYLQDNITLPVGGCLLSAQLGVRGSMMANLDSRYTMSRKPYFDPRLNLQWRFPEIGIAGKRMVIDLNGGWGRQTKFPTLLQLYPDKIYTDLIELNYYNLNPEYKRLHLRTYIDDPTNYALLPARNDKWELRLGAQYDGYSLSITYFRERMNDGFRSSSSVRPYSYRDYDEGAINGNTLTGKPSLDNLPYTDKKILGTYSTTTNGSRMIKEGMEWLLSTKRLDAIKTRLTVNGAWFRTTYTNSQPMFRSNTTAVIEGTPVNDLYIGCYDSRTGNVREQLNTNFMADTYIPRLDLSFSITAECMWYTSSRSIRSNGVPLEYMDNEGNIHEYTEECKSDTYLQWLVNKYNDSAWLTQRVPFYMFLNLKVTKGFGKWMKAALFVNRMIDYMPDYTTNSGLKVRRTSKPYFGMEMNFSI